MSGLEFTVKKTELVKAIKEQVRTGRAVFKIPLPEDEDEAKAIKESYEQYVSAYSHRGELGRGKVLCRMKVEEKITEVEYSVRIVAVIETKKGYQVDVKFNDKDLII